MITEEDRTLLDNPDGEPELENDTTPLDEEEVRISFTL